MIVALPDQLMEVVTVSVVLKQYCSRKDCTQMTDSTHTQKPWCSRTIADLPQPEPMCTDATASAEAGTALPRPAASLSNVTDSGRISFGAGFRLRIGK
jgi:hypothetical protein